MGSPSSNLGQLKVGKAHTDSKEAEAEASKRESKGANENEDASGTPDRETVAACDPAEEAIDLELEKTKSNYSRTESFKSDSEKLGRLPKWALADITRLPIRLTPEVLEGKEGASSRLNPRDEPTGEQSKHGLEVEGIACSEEVQPSASAGARIGAKAKGEINRSTTHVSGVARILAEKDDVVPSNGETNSWATTNVPHSRERPVAQNEVQSPPQPTISVILSDRMRSALSNLSVAVCQKHPEQNGVAQRWPFNNGRSLAQNTTAGANIATEATKCREVMQPNQEICHDQNSSSVDEQLNGDPCSEVNASVSEHRSEKRRRWFLKWTRKPFRRNRNAGAA